MSGHLVAKIELVVLLFESQCGDTGLKALVSLVGPSLTAVGCKFVHEYSERDTGLAAIAVGTVGEESTAPEALGDELRVGVALDQVAWRCNLRARLTIL